MTSLLASPNSQQSFSLHNTPPCGAKQPRVLEVNTANTKDKAVVFGGGKMLPKPLGTMTYAEMSARIAQLFCRNSQMECRIKQLEGLYTNAKKQLAPLRRELVNEYHEKTTIAAENQTLRRENQRLRKELVRLQNFAGSLVNRV